MRTFILALLVLSFLPASAQVTLIPYRVKDKWGYSDTAGRLLIRPRFDRALFFFEGWAEVSMGTKQGLIDEKGAWVIPPLYAEFRTLHEPGCGALRYAVTSTGRTAVYHLPSGRLLLDTLYDALVWHYPCRFEVRSKDKVGVYDAQIQKWLARPEYDQWVTNTPRQEPVLSRGGQLYVIQGSGEAVQQREQEQDRIPPVVEVLRDAAPAEQPSGSTPAVPAPAPLTPEPAALPVAKVNLDLPQPYWENGKAGFRFIRSFIRKYGYRTDGVVVPEVLPPQYEAVDGYWAEEDILAARLHGRWGVVDARNRTLLPFRFEALDLQNSAPKAGIYAVPSGPSRALVDSTGKVIAGGLDGVERGIGFLRLHLDGLVGIYFTGEPVEGLPLPAHRLLAPKYRSVDPFAQNARPGKKPPYVLIGVQTQGGKGYITPDGRAFFRD